MTSRDEPRSDKDESKDSSWDGRDRRLSKEEWEQRLKSQLNDSLVDKTVDPGIDVNPPARGEAQGPPRMAAASAQQSDDSADFLKQPASERPLPEQPVSEKSAPKPPASDYQRPPPRLPDDVDDLFEPSASSDRSGATRPVVGPDQLTHSESGARSGFQRREAKAVLSLAFVVLFGFLVYLVMTSRLSTVNSADTVGRAADGDVQAEPDGAFEGLSGSETEAQPGASSIGVESSAPQAGASLVRAILAADEVRLEGEVSSEEAAESLALLLQPLAGDGGVVSELVVSPDANTVEGISMAVADEVLFAAGSDALSDEFFPTLNRIVALMELRPNLTVVVEGHTDSRGDEVTNLALSQRRADAVVDYMAENSINRFRLEPRGRGSGEPIDDNSTEDGRDRNRRIEFEIVGLDLDS